METTSCSTILNESVEKECSILTWLDNFRVTMIPVSFNLSAFASPRLQVVMVELAERFSLAGVRSWVQSLA